MTRFDSNFGVGKRCCRIFFILMPRFVLKLWKIRCGNASLMASGFFFRSCLMITFFRPKYRVGPSGICDIIIPSGCPLCSWSTTTSVTSFLTPISTSSFSSMVPLLILTELGKIRFISFENCESLVEGWRLVVRRIFGVFIYSLLYSSSMCVLGAIVTSSAFPSCSRILPSSL